MVQAGSGAGRSRLGGEDFSVAGEGYLGEDCGQKDGVALS